ncbi:hypothetical protein CAC42_3828 [Sphaceloma murrayae]|uniref:Serine/arginine repetitive matrix protein 1 n=1 Tax=Sphaceloma murrayae TaxID=2082308 RepID=A0A2K1QI45_9PEZI|nr:hypothetical protein CAC42_3828 [Sphaceloma murrayae]
MDRGPDRSRRPDLPANVPEEDRFGTGGGQSYRPNRSPPPRPDYRRRSPPPRAPAYQDPYRRPVPSRPRSRSPPYRRRSRSPPPYRSRDADFRPRPRSPPRREYERDLGYRGPPPRDVRDMRDEPRYRDRSPPRPFPDRSPMHKRSRDVSPSSNRGRYSPPPPKRERLGSPGRSRFNDYPMSRDRSPPRRGYSPPRDRRPSPPRGIPGDYVPASRSPMRQIDRVDPRAKDNWRRRSPSPRRTDVAAAPPSGRDSGATSRRSSPPVHPSRLAVIGDDRARGPRDDYAARGPISNVPSPRPRSPPRKQDIPGNSYRDAPVPVRPAAAPAKEESVERPPPTGPGGARAPTEVPSGPSRAPPTGPRPSASSVPSAPRAAPQQMPAATRSELPSGPRGRGGPFSAPSYRGRGGFQAPPGRDPESSHSIPSGPRSGPPPSGPFRSTPTANAPTYPRSQRFAPNGAPIPTSPGMAGGRKMANPYLASLPPLLDEGKKLPPLYDRSRLDKLEEETERMRKLLDEKQAKKRKGLREWERLEREVQLAELRGTLAEDSLIAMSGGDGGGAAF